MSGGYFNYKQYNINDIVEAVVDLIKNNDCEDVDEYGDRIWKGYSKETIDEFKKGVEYLSKAAIYAQIIDWLVEDDDGEDSFHERLKEELEECSRLLVDNGIKVSENNEC